MIENENEKEKERIRIRKKSEWLAAIAFVVGITLFGIIGVLALITPGGLFAIPLMLLVPCIFFGVSTLGYSLGYVLFRAEKYIQKRFFSELNKMSKIFEKPDDATEKQTIKDETQMEGNQGKGDSVQKREEKQCFSIEEFYIDFVGSKLNHSSEEYTWNNPVQKTGWDSALWVGQYALLKPEHFPWEEILDKMREKRIINNELKGAVYSEPLLNWFVRYMVVLAKDRTQGHVPISDDKKLEIIKKLIDLGANTNLEGRQIQNKEKIDHISASFNPFMMLIKVKNVYWNDYPWAGSKDIENRDHIALISQVGKLLVQAKDLKGNYRYNNQNLRKLLTDIGVVTNLGMLSLKGQLKKVLYEELALRNDLKPQDVAEEHFRDRYFPTYYSGRSP